MTVATRLPSVLYGSSISSEVDDCSCPTHTSTSSAELLPAQTRYMNEGSVRLHRGISCCHGSDLEELQRERVFRRESPLVLQDIVGSVMLPQIYDHMQSRSAASYDYYCRTERKVQRKALS